MMNPEILLASQSPRRKELVENLGLQFSLYKIDIEETYPANLPPDEVAGFLSNLKATGCKNLADHQILLTADTIVVLDGEILGKPKSFDDAARMLKMLSGKTHTVFTAFTLRSNQKTITKTDHSLVSIAQLDDVEIKYYLGHHQPYDKAGSYGVQDWLGLAKVSAISGSFYTVMGLPVHLVYKTLREEFGFALDNHCK